MTEPGPAPHPLRVHLALLCVSLLFGVNYVATKRLVGDVAPAAWVLYRIAGGGLLLVALAAIWRRPWPRGGMLLWLGIAGLLGVLLNQILFTEGMARTTPARSAVLNATIPVWTMLLAVRLRQEHLRPSRIVAVLLALGGVLVLLRADRGFEGAGGTLLGDLLTLANVLCFALFLVLMRALRAGADPVAAAAWFYVIATPFAFGYAHGAVEPQDLAELTAPGVWPWALHAIAGATVLTYLLNNWALRHTDPSRVALYIPLQPVVATALSIVIGLEAPQARFWIALALVGSALLVEAVLTPSRRGKAGGPER